MKILVTGASGFVGKRLLRRLLLEGHQVNALTRNVEKFNEIGLPVKAFKWDPLSSNFPQDSLDGVEAVINLMGENLSSKRWTDNQKKKIHDSRIKGTKHLVDAIEKYLQNPLKVFISVSAIGIYPTKLKQALDEGCSEYPQSFLSKVCQEWEAEALKLKNTERTVIPRLGVVLGPESGMISKLAPIFRIGGGGPIGLGKEFLSWIHVEDLVGVLTHALSDERLSGVVNATSPNPVTNAHFTKAFGKALKRPAFFPVPPFILKIAFGEMSTIMLDGQKIKPKKLLEINFDYQYPTIEKALNEICKNFTFGGESFYRDEFVRFQYVDIPLEKIFPFFAAPDNLEKITPDFLNFKILNSSDKTIKQGTKIDYKLRLRGLPLKWRTLITEWEQDKKFSDLQEKGPYKFWHHTHLFHPYEGGTIIEDRVVYRIPFGPIGEIARPMVIKDIDQIFKYRKRALEKMIKNKEF
jgi:uncharacterized protein (TIGR01777 family)